MHGSGCIARFGAKLVTRIGNTCSFFMTSTRFPQDLFWGRLSVITPIYPTRQTAREWVQMHRVAVSRRMEHHDSDFGNARAPIRILEMRGRHDLDLPPNSDFGNARAPLRRTSQFEQCKPSSFTIVGGAAGEQLQGSEVRGWNRPCPSWRGCEFPGGARRGRDASPPPVLRKRHVTQCGHWG